MVDCQHCQHDHFCCTFKVKLTWFDIFKIKLNGYSDFWERDSQYKSIKSVDNYCYFLDKNKKCKIHSIRPKPCRDFPFSQSCQELHSPWKKHQDKINRLIKKPTHSKHT